VNLSPLILEYWALERLLSPSRKLRKNDPAVARMASSIGAYGFKIPILVSSEGEIIDGDLRLKAARKLGFVEVPVIVCDDWTPEQVRGSKAADTITGHGTQKPVELMRRPLRNHTERGGLVYDPFLGSGSTLIAAEDTGRVCYGLELSPAYVDVIVERWQKLTGRKAALEEDGRGFDEIARERVGARAEVVDAAA
jgi:hypothetical protein